MLSGDFDAGTYTAWLRQMGVKYIFLPHAPLDWSGPRETQILETSSYFTRVWSDSEWTVYRLKDPYWEITEGKGSLRQSSEGSDFLVLHATHPGKYGIQVQVTLQQSLRELVQIF